jgi:predicted patatin/cPLA2 family phospholipase
LTSRSGPDARARTAIVVEGGAMRGIFSAGVLDALLEAGLTDFDFAFGTSAGACNLASFVSRQLDRNRRCYVDIMCRPTLFSWPRFLRGGHYIELDWLWERFREEDPLDLLAMARCKTQLVSVATCARSGEPHFTVCRPDAVWEPVKGSCAMPVLYRGPVHFEGAQLVDGGISAPFAAPAAYAFGARRMVVVRSRPSGAVRVRPWREHAAGLALRGQPALARAVRSSSDVYAECLRFLSSPPQDVRVVEIAPPEVLRSKSTTQDRATLRHDYDLGLRTGRKCVPRVAELLVGVS